MLYRRAVKNTGKLALSLIIGLVLLNFSPATVKADNNTVDLELGGEGATSWNITNIQPGDGGTKTVELHNAGSKYGFVTLWVSDIVSSEGINPEPETGDTAEPGELNDYLLFNLTADNLTSSINLPVTINNLPKRATWPDFIDVIPLMTGETINLQWDWGLPAQTGNDAQGDSVSFTINYLLEGFEVTDVLDIVDQESGVFTNNVTVESEGGNGKLTIGENTTGQTAQGESLREIWVVEIDKEPSTPSPATATVGAHYVAGPYGTTFDPPITLTVTYDPDDLPERAREEELSIIRWDKATRQWVELEGCTVDTINKTITVEVDHFSRYTILATVPPPPPPPSPPPPPVIFPEPTPPAVKEEEKPPPPTPVPVEEERAIAVLETNMLGDKRKIEIEADGILREPLTLTDPNGEFVIEVDAGSKIISSDGRLLTRIELMSVEESIVIPENMVILSPIYKLTGYINELESAQINFNPSARLTIRYDPKNLPENAFLPFVANYTVEQGLVRLQPPPDSLVEIGKAKALVSHASLFVVMVEVAPPPPPLPAKFEASDLIINPQQAYTGETVTISLTIANEGATAGTYELHLIIDGIVRAIEEVSLAGQSRETLTFEVSNLAVGSHQVKVAGLTGRFKIIRASVLPGEAGVNWLVLDASVGAVLFIGLVILYFIIRRSRRAKLT